MTPRSGKITLGLLAAFAAGVVFTSIIDDAARDASDPKKTLQFSVEDPNNPADMKKHIDYLERELALYRSNKVDPYSLSIQIDAPHWDGVVYYLQKFAYEAEHYGPEIFSPSGGGADNKGNSYSINMRNGYALKISNGESYFIDTSKGMKADDPIIDWSGRTNLLRCDSKGKCK